MIYRASQTPGPGQYNPEDKRRETGKFSTSKPKSDVEWKIYNASKIPGPGQCVPLHSLHQSLFCASDDAAVVLQVRPA